VPGGPRSVDPTDKLAVVVLINTAIADAISAFPEAVRAAVYASD